MDEVLRARERRASDPAGRVAFLRERVRAGALSLDRLRLAAYLGDAAAEAALAGAPGMVAGVDAPVVDVADDAAFARVLEAERAVGMVFMQWSGPAHMFRRRFREVHAPVLRGLTPETQVGTFVLQPEHHGGGDITRWLQEYQACFDPLNPLDSGAGEMFWVRERRILRAEHPATVLQPADFVRVTVDALGLGLDDV